MTRTRLPAMPIIMAVALLAGCGLTSPDYDDISGTWNSPVSGTLGPYTISGTIALSLTQQDGDLAGTWNSSQEVGGITFVGGGSIEGTIAEGRNPAVSITASYPTGTCYQPMHFTGSNNSEARELTVSGSVAYYDGCSVIGVATLTLRLVK